MGRKRVQGRREKIYLDVERWRGGKWKGEAGEKGENPPRLT